jgi:putative membrane protein
MTIFLLATFTFALSAQQSSSPGEPKKQDQSPTTQQNTAPTQTTTTLDKDDSSFLKDAAHDGAMEVQVGRLAVDKTTNPDVKQFAQRLIDDHSKANSELMALASQKGVVLPTMSDMAVVDTNRTATDQATATSQAMDKQAPADTSATTQRHARVDSDAMLKDQKEISKLSGLSGDAFDRAFIDEQVKGHEKDVKEFEKVSTKAKDPDIRAFAAKTLPTLREHLQMARDIQSRLKATSK